MENQNHKPVVLLVDDCKDTLAMLRLLFESAGADVLTCASGDEALSLLASRSKSSFDMLVTDIRMPNLNGEELTKRFRENGFSGRIVALTATATGQGRGESLKNGADVYLSKKAMSRKVIDSLVADIRNN